jgi:peptidoglycan/xylan/chitin deacetylase (PgdA/CDA1 family)
LGFSGTPRCKQHQRRAGPVCGSVLHPGLGGPAPSRADAAHRGRGHELASHGLDHARVFTLGAERFAADLSESRKILEDAGGVAIKGYRAPSFSIDTRTPWAHPILAEQGYDYSSSVAPIAHDHYGWRDAPRFAFRR